MEKWKRMCPVLPHRAGFKSENKSELLGISDERINLDKPFSPDVGFIAGKTDENE